MKGGQINSITEEAEVPQRKRALSPQNHTEDDTEEGNDPDIEDTPEATGDSLPAVTNDGIVSNNETQLSQQSKRSRKTIPEANLNTTSSSRRLNLPGISAVERAIDKLGTIASHNIETDNEFDHFCRSLAVQLKKMPLDRALICQTKLQNVMTEERMYLFRMEHALSNTSTAVPSPYTVYSSNSDITTSAATPIMQDQEGYSEGTAYDVLSQALSTIHNNYD
ncbi:hypothetical protein FQR65_LT00021 [Abscondita terminalis]|nr:hypothetical protein FQR65_LT00021 [Abscondita terminalis]